MIKNLISNGFVASHLADLLLEKGEEVYVYYRWTDDRSAFKHIISKVNWVLMDLNDLSSCIKAIEEVSPDYIYHLGSQSSVPASFIYPAETIKTNTIGTLNLLEAVRLLRELPNTGKVCDECEICDYGAECNKEKLMFDPTIIIVSSSEVYGQVDRDKLPITEDTPLSPNNPYAVGKIGEDMIGLVYWKNYGLKIIRTRFFTHTGPRRTMMSAECYYAKRIAEIEKEQRVAPNAQVPICIIKTGNMESIRTWADVRDAVRAYYLLARNGTYGEVYNIGGETVKSIQEVLDYMLSISSLNKDKIKFEEDPTLLRKADVDIQTVDITKLKNTIDWKPEISFETTMRDVLNYWRDNV